MLSVFFFKDYVGAKSIFLPEKPGLLGLPRSVSMQDTDSGHISKLLTFHILKTTRFLQEPADSNATAKA